MAATSRVVATPMVAGATMAAAIPMAAATSNAPSSRPRLLPCLPKRTTISPSKANLLTRQVFHQAGYSAQQGAGFSWNMAQENRREQHPDKYGLNTVATSRSWRGFLAIPPGVFPAARASMPANARHVKPFCSSRRGMTQINF